MHFPWGNNPPKLPLPWGELGPHLTHGSLGPPESPTQNSTSTGSAVSLQYSLPILYNGTGGACPPKTASSPGGIRAPPNTWFLRPSESTIQTASRLDQTFLSLYFTMGQVGHVPPNCLFSSLGDRGSYPIYGSTQVHNPNGISIGSSVFV